MSDFRTDSIDFCGNSFIEFLEHLYAFKIDLEYSDDFKQELDRRDAYYKNGGKMIDSDEVERNIDDLLKSGDRGLKV